MTSLPRIGGHRCRYLEWGSLLSSKQFTRSRLREFTLLIKIFGAYRYGCCFITIYSKTTARDTFGSVWFLCQKPALCAVIKACEEWSSWHPSLHSRVSNRCLSEFWCVSVPWTRVRVGVRWQGSERGLTGEWEQLSRGMSTGHGMTHRLQACHARDLLSRFPGAWRCYVYYLWHICRCMKTVALGASVRMCARFSCNIDNNITLRTGSDPLGFTKKE